MDETQMKFFIDFIQQRNRINRKQYLKNQNKRLHRLWYAIVGRRQTWVSAVRKDIRKFDWQLPTDWKLQCKPDTAEEFVGPQRGNSRSLQLIPIDSVQLERKSRQFKEF